MILSKKIYPFIVVDGVDGVGKSTLVTNLADSLGFESYKTPSAKYRAVRGHFDSLAQTNPMERFNFYAEGVRDSSEEILESLEYTGVVADRYLDSLQLYHEALVGKSLNQEVKDLDVHLPNLRIILNGNESELFNRRTERAILFGALQDSLESDRQLMADMVDRYQSLNPVTPQRDLLYIDTTDINESEVLGLCLNHLTRHKFLN